MVDVTDNVEDWLLLDTTTTELELELELAGTDELELETLDELAALEDVDDEAKPQALRFFHTPDS